MTLTELLDQCRRDYLDDYTEMISGADDQLIRDASLIRWFNEAENQIASETSVLVSEGPTNSAITQLTLAVGVNDYSLDPRVVRVLSVRPSNTVYDLTRTDYNGIRQTHAMYRSQDYFDVNSTGTVTPGQPSWFATDVESYSLRVRPTPSSVEDGLTMNMRVVHLPVNVLSSSDLGASPEIPVQHHHLLVLYAAARALSGVSVDLGSVRAAGRAFMAEFRAGIKAINRATHRRTRATAMFHFGAWASDGSE